MALPRTLHAALRWLSSRAVALAAVGAAGCSLDGTFEPLRVSTAGAPSSPAPEGVPDESVGGGPGVATGAGAGGSAEGGRGSEDTALPPLSGAAGGASASGSGQQGALPSAVDGGARPNEAPAASAPDCPADCAAAGDCPPGCEPVGTEEPNPVDVPPVEVPPAQARCCGVVVPQGTVCQACPNGSLCRAGGECASQRCAFGRCAAPPPDPCQDGELGGAESDVDCGGGTCGACAPGRACRADGDCASSVCVDGRCCGGTGGDCTRCAERLSAFTCSSTLDGSLIGGCISWLSCLRFNPDVCAQPSVGTCSGPGAICNPANVGGFGSPPVNQALAVLQAAGCQL